MADPVLLTLSVLTAVMLGGFIFSAQTNVSCVNTGMGVLSKRISFYVMPYVVRTNPEFAKFVASNSNLFKMKYPIQIMKMTGLKSFAFKDGARHQSVKKLLIRALRAETLKNHVHAWRPLMRTTWQSGSTVLTRLLQKMKLKSLRGISAIGVLFGDTLRSNTPEGLKNLENFKQIMQALVSIPLKVPETTYARSLKERKLDMASRLASKLWSSNCK